MKLQTMLLPTGEFVLILSEAPEAYAEWAEDFKEKAGAAAMLVTTEPLEVVDALVDEAATRHWVDVEDDWDGPPDDDGEPAEIPEGPGSVIQFPSPFPRLPAREARGVDGLLVAFDGSRSDTAVAHFEVGVDGGVTALTGDPGDDLVAAAINRGDNFSPAGLVKGPQTTAQLEPELADALKYIGTVTRSAGGTRRITQADIDATRELMISCGDDGETFVRSTT